MVAAGEPTDPMRERFRAEVIVHMVSDPLDQLLPKGQEATSAIVRRVLTRGESSTFFPLPGISLEKSLRTEVEVSCACCPIHHV